MNICWERANSWLPTFAVLLYAILIVCVPFPYGVWGRRWNFIVLVPDHCLFPISTFQETLFSQHRDITLNINLLPGHVAKLVAFQI